MTIIDRNRGHILGLLAAVIAVIAVITVTAACGTGAPSTPAGSPTSGGEVNPAGDIPDNQVYVPFTPPGARFTVSVPEGWTQTASGSATLFTDKLNTVRIESVDRADAPSVASATAQELPVIESTTPGYGAGSVTMVQRKAGPAVLITYRATAPANPVTGKTISDAVERYELWRDGHELILTLSGPVGADNVDPWRTITDSIAWTS